MIIRNIKLFLGISVLLAYISVGVFGLLSFSHADNGMETPMIDCPYTETSSSLCENTLDHIIGWQQFSNIISSTLFIFSLIILGIVLYFFSEQSFLNQQHYFYKWKYYLYSKKLYTSTNKIIKWLSLFENSPSLSYMRHS